MNSKALAFGLLSSFCLLIMLILGSHQPGFAAQAPDVQLTATRYRVTATPSITPTPTPSPTVSSVFRVRSRTPYNGPYEELYPRTELALSVPVAAETLLRAITVYPEIEFDIEVNGEVATVQFLEPIPMGVSHTFVINRSEMRASGYAMTLNYSWVIEAAPVIHQFKGIHVGNPLGPISFNFTYPLDPASFEASLDADELLLGEITWREDYKQVEIEPAAKLPYDTAYVLRFQTDLITPDGRNLGIPEAVSFTTPSVVADARPSGQSTVRPSVHSIVEIIFSELMDPISTANAASISPDIPGEWVVEENSLIFRPLMRFDGDIEYNVIIDESALNADLESILEEPYRLTFHTAYYYPPLSFGFGPNVQVLRADGRRALQYGYFSSKTEDLATFELYRVPPSRFAEMYAATTKTTRWWSDLGMLADYTQLELIASWELNPDDPPRETFIPADVSKGIYLVNLVTEAGQLEDQLFVNLTDHLLVSKKGADQVTGWVSRIDGDPLLNGQMWVFNEEGEVINRGDIDQNGIFKTGFDPGDQPFVIMSQIGDDFSISGFSSRWQASAGNRTGDQDRIGNPQAEIYAITDRPIYKPGDMVNFKSIVRQQDDALYSLPPVGSAVEVRVLDPRGNALQSYTLNSDDFGTVHSTFLIEEGVTLGNFEIETTFKGKTDYQQFKVEDYRKPDIDVSLKTDRPYYLPGDSIEIEIDANFFFGEPVKAGEVSVLRFMNQAVESYNPFEGRWEEGEPRWAMAGVDQSEISGKTDENGKLMVTMEIPDDLSFSRDGGCYYCYYRRNSEGIRSIDWGIEATIDDGSNQPVSGFVPVKIFESDEGAYLNQFGYLQKPGVPFVIAGGIKRVDGSPVAGREGTVTVARYNRNGGYALRLTETVTTGEVGTFQTDLSLAEKGFYRVILKGEDNEGRAYSVTRFVYVIDQEYSDWWSSSKSLITVTPDRSSYQPGDVAQLIVESTISGPALMSIERGTVRREMLVELTAPLTLIDLPIDATDVPNIHVAINAWRPLDSTLSPDSYYTRPDGDVVVAYANLSVPAIDKKLNVEIIPNQERYSTREEGSFRIRVTNYQGEPVSADLSFALVDEAIFALSEELSGPMHNAFYYERGTTIRTYHAFEPDRFIGQAGGKGGGGGDGGIGMGTQPRADFPDTQVWLPNLRTDFNGEVVVNVTLPDSLTTWRATVKAATGDTQVGEAIAKVNTWQPFIIRPLLPRQLTAGDQVDLSAVVYNNSDEPATLALSLVTDGEAQVEVIGDTQQSIFIPAGESRIVGWPLESETAGEVILTLRGSADGVPVDAIALPLTVNPLAVRDVTAYTGQFLGSLEQTISIPGDAHPDSMLEIALSRTVAGTLLEGLEDLTGYPYGCVEQTMSRALPNAVVGRALNQLGLVDPALQAQLPDLLRASVHRLYGFQHRDGGWGWWYQDPSDDYQTAWVIFGLAQMAEAGYEIEPKVLEQGAEWMNRELERMDPRTKAFALYAMAVAGQPNPEETLALYEDLDTLRGDVFSLAGLALTLDRIDADESAQEILDLLLSTATISENGMIFWEGSDSDGYYLKKTMASDVRSTALVLSAFAQLRPNDEDNVQLGMVKWLMSQRQSFGWGTTNETSFAILGLTDHLLAVDQAAGSQQTRVQIFVNGEEVGSGLVTSNQPSLVVQLPREGLDLDSENKIEIIQTGERPIYYAINSNLLLAREEIGAKGPIEVERRYLDPETGKELDSIVAGQLVRVDLKVVLPEAGSYMIIEDKLPGGLEALNEGLNTTSRAVDGMVDYVDYNKPRSYSYKEIRSDRVSFFVTEIRQDNYRHHIYYIARATMSGEFVAMPAEAYAMYQTELWGRSESQPVVILAEPPVVPELPEPPPFDVPEDVPLTD